MWLKQSFLFDLEFYIPVNTVKVMSSWPSCLKHHYLTSSLAVKMLTVLISTISNSQVFLLKNVNSFCKAFHIFSAKIFIYVIFNDQSFKVRLTNNIISFEQLGPGNRPTL